MSNNFGLHSFQEGWLHELVQAELFSDAQKILDIKHSFDPQSLVEQSGIQFLGSIRDILTGYSQRFNSFSEKGQKFQEIKIYSVAQSSADFMLFRNQMKLIFSLPHPGIIHVSFHFYTRPAVFTEKKSVFSSSADSPENYPEEKELTAQVGPFKNVFWTFEGEKVLPEQIAQFYFVEFIHLTRSVSEKSKNQPLLNQIKALLQEKGLHL